MELRNLVASTVASIALMALSLPASASIVTLDFDDLQPQTATTNLTYNGFRISPNCHYDVVPSLPNSPTPGFAGSQWLGFDSHSCGSFFNANFLGPVQYQAPTLGNTVLWMDYGGHPFTLLSLFDVTQNWTLQSSKGGVLESSFLTRQETIAFDGPDWTGIKWLLFSIPAPGAGAPFGFDNFTARVPGGPVARVPEPSTLALLGIAFAGLGFSRRRKLH